MLTEISIVRGEIRQHLRHLGEWMRPAPPTPLKLLPAKSRIVSRTARAGADRRSVELPRAVAAESLWSAPSRQAAPPC